MYEVERKVRASHAEVREQLDDVGAEFLATVEQRDIYFDHPVRDFADTDEALRVRRQLVSEGSAEVSDQLTYKGPRLDTNAKTRIERESTLGNADEVVAILETLDFDPAGRVEKTRERYRTQTCDICLDTVEGLGEFVEVEIHERAEDLGAAERTTEDVADALGLGDAEPIHTSYLGMILDSNERA